MSDKPTIDLEGAVYDLKNALRVTEHACRDADGVSVKQIYTMVMANNLALQAILQHLINKEKDDDVVGAESKAVNCDDLSDVKCQFIEDTKIRIATGEWPGEKLSDKPPLEGEHND